jgi:hypothetical protein
MTWEPLTVALGVSSEPYFRDSRLIYVAGTFVSALPCSFDNHSSDPRLRTDPSGLYRLSQNRAADLAAILQSGGGVLCSR